ncbi:FecR family protein [Steroidobacter sp.]|uniref:FecR family protein n=1 Tax=Steroidobacter sp. TaxID=1978227 RepID=UPI001A5AEA16|nr:FecR domain-containing protein [Steroidobacter sp.]MBL8267690.1 FecR domain-containing protein [Steroidobacter sp.]
MDVNDRRARATHDATQWWHRLSAAPTQVSKADRELFTQWLRESPLHVAEFLRIAHVHDSLERFKLWGEIDGDAAGVPDNVVPIGQAAEHESDPVRGHEDEARVEKVRSRVRIWATAASVCFVAIVAAWFALGARGDVIETELAERRQVMLDDGTVVQLEPETQLRVKFDEHLRHVTLERGRALFRVTKNAQRPFVVNADNTSVRAVGTAFGVENSKRGVVVTVAEGKVAVARSEAGEAPSIGASLANNSTEILLTAGQQLTVPTAGAVDPVRAVDTARALAWADGQLVFENETLADVIAEFNRYNRTQLRISDGQLAGRKVSGVFDATDTETLLDFIRQSGTEVEISQTDDGIVIRSPGR